MITDRFSYLKDRAQKQFAAILENIDYICDQYDEYKFNLQLNKPEQYKKMISTGEIRHEFARYYLIKLNARHIPFDHCDVTLDLLKTAIMIQGNIELNNKYSKKGN